MGDVPIPVEVEEPADHAEFAARLVDLRDRLDDAAHVTLTATSKGSIRRPVLFIIVGVALILGVPAVGIVGLIILALTDQVVTL